MIQGWLGKRIGNARPWETTTTLSASSKIDVNKPYALIITEIGTTATTAVDLKVNNKPVFEMRADWAYTKMYSSNLFGRFKLPPDLAIAVPPDSHIGCSGSATVCLRGVLFDNPDAQLLRWMEHRLNEQPDYRIKIDYSSLTWASGSAWGDEVAKEVAEIVNKSNERRIYRFWMGAAIDNTTELGYDDINVELLLNDKPLEPGLDDAGTALHEGYQMQFMLLPPTTTYMDQLWFDKHPITLEPDDKLTVNFVNVSGSSATPTANRTLTWAAPCVYQRF